MPRATRPLLIVAVLLMVSGIGVAAMRIVDERGEVAVDDPAANAEEHAPVDPAGNGTDLDGEPDADDPHADDPDPDEPDVDEPDEDEYVGRDADGGDAGADTATSGEVDADLPGTGELPDTGPSGASVALGAAAVAIAATRRRRLA